MSLSNRWAASPAILRSGAWSRGLRKPWSRFC